MNLQQVIMGLGLALALSSCVCAIAPKHVAGGRGGRGGRSVGESGYDYNLQRWPETYFDLANPNLADAFRRIFKVVSSEQEFSKMYPCPNLEAAELISFRFTTRPGIWTRVVYRVIIELSNDLKDMIFVEIFDTLSETTKPFLLAIRNRMSSVDRLPEHVDHFINGCPAPHNPIPKRFNV